MVYRRLLCLMFPCLGGDLGRCYIIEPRWGQKWFVDMCLQKSPTLLDSWRRMSWFLLQWICGEETSCPWLDNIVPHDFIKLKSLQWFHALICPIANPLSCRYYFVWVTYKGYQSFFFSFCLFQAGVQLKYEYNLVCMAIKVNLSTFLVEAASFTRCFLVL